GDDLDRQGEGAQRLHHLGGVGDDEAAGRGLPDQLLAQQGRAAALDQGQARPDLVGAVDGQVDARRILEGGKRQAELAGQVGGGLGGGGAAQAGQVAGGQRPDERGGGGAGAEADGHARLDAEGGGFAGEFFLEISGHGGSLEREVEVVLSWSGFIG